jgi:hypothetical protein
MQSKSDEVRVADNIVRLCTLTVRSLVYSSDVERFRLVKRLKRTIFTKLKVVPLPLPYLAFHYGIAHTVDALAQDNEERLTHAVGRGS